MQGGQRRQPHWTLDPAVAAAHLAQQRGGGPVDLFGAGDGKPAGKGPSAVRSNRREPSAVSTARKRRPTVVGSTVSARAAAAGVPCR